MCIHTESQPSDLHATRPLLLEMASDIMREEQPSPCYQANQAFAWVASLCKVELNSKVASGLIVLHTN